MVVREYIKSLLVDREYSRLLAVKIKSLSIGINDFS